MTTLLQLVVWMTLLTWVSIMAAAFLRNRESTPTGMALGLGNRDNLPEATPLGGLRRPRRQQHLGELHPVYRAGAHGTRSLWAVGTVGLALMLSAILSRAGSCR